MFTVSETWGGIICIWRKKWNSDTSECYPHPPPEIFNLRKVCSDVSEKFRL